MDHTEQKIAKLTPTVEELEKNFEENQQDGVQQPSFIQRLVWILGLP